MRALWAFGAILLLAAPGTQAALVEWSQPNGDGEHSGVASLDPRPLDVLAGFRFLSDGEIVERIPAKDSLRRRMASTA